MAKVPLPYGDSLLEVDIPGLNAESILTAKFIAGLKHPEEAIRNSLENPLGCQGLRSLLNDDDKVVIITTDNTRPCPDDIIVPVILEMLTAILPPENITVIIGLGLHPPLNHEQLVKKLGKDIIDRFKVFNHDPSETINIGETSRGVPVEINKKVAEADFRISTGFIEPHFFAGFSGGRKSIAPAVSSARSIRNNHSYRMLDNPCSRAGILKNNPVHEDMVEQARMARLDFIVNVTLNSEGEITHVFSGDPVIAHETGCQIASKNAQIPITSAYDITLTTNGGAPLDLDFYQTCKGIDTAAQITRKGGIIIMAAACDQGIGPEEFRILHTSSKSPEDVLAKLSRSSSYAEGVSWQNQLLGRAQQDHEIFLFSNLTDDEISPMMITPIHSVEEGLEIAYKRLGADSRVGVIPRGPLALPMMIED